MRVCIHRVCIPRLSALIAGVVLTVLNPVYAPTASQADEPDVEPPAAVTGPESGGESTADHPSAARPAANRLARESSPYLLMHAHNPVDWYPWGPEAFDKARSEGKMIFLSIGYSSCYWCHVMERETFSNQKVADYLNQNFVCVKVDREERPDIDDIYMTSLIVYQQAAGRAGGGGWPLSMFLTPDGDPIAGATFLPPDDTPDGRTGFITAARTLMDVWTTRREPATASAAMIAAEVRRLSGASVLVEAAELKPELLTAVRDDIVSKFDPEHGGVDFNPRRPDGPRFPNVPRLLFLLHRLDQSSDERLSTVVNESLEAMARGGIRDHLGGGFHRYSTDREWVVPHFEKMLYDQAQLLEAYALASLQSSNPMYDEVIDELIEFMRREMTLPDGGFCAALDAETNAIEGEFYVWTEAQVRDVLSADEADRFMQTYGFAEPQSFEHGRVLYLPPQQPWFATDAEIASMRAIRDKLLAKRSERPRPFLDDKVLTEWNALMIQALAVSGRLPGRSEDLSFASRAADFLLTTLRGVDGQLHRSWRNGTRGPLAYLDDYACLVSALIELHQSTGDDRWLISADELQQKQIELFYDDSVKAFYFTSADHEKLFARGCSPYDSVSPSGNGMTVRNLVRLGQLKDKPRYLEIAGDTLARFSGTIAGSPAACSGLGLALQDYLSVTQSNPNATMKRKRDRAVVQRETLRLGAIVLTSAQDAEPKAQDAELKNEEGAQQAFKPVVPDPSAPASPFRRSYTERPVKAKIFPMFDKLERGGKCPVAIELTIADEWHINANPASPDFLIPTEVTIKSEHKVEMTKVKYPKHELLEVEGQDQPSHVYGGKVIIYALLEVAAEETADKAELEIEVKFQACNERTCEPPDAIKLKGKLPLANPGDEIKRINESKFPKDDAKTEEEPADGGRSRTGDQPPKSGP